MSTYKPGDRVLLVPGTEPIEAVHHDRAPTLWRIERTHGYMLLDDNDIAALGFTVQPMPLAEPPIGSRVRCEWPSGGVHEYERVADGKWIDPQRVTGWVAWSLLSSHVVAIGTPSFTWQEVER